MNPATAWAGDARSWTVLGRLLDRQQVARQHRDDARKRIRDRRGKFALMTAALLAQQFEDDLAARWAGSSTVLALLFAHPESDAVRVLDERGAYFDIRTGDTWDLFFAGYYRSDRGPQFESQCGARSAGTDYARDWYFNPREFNTLREHVERESEGRWQYSGDIDLVLANAWIPEAGPATIDWVSTKSGTLTDRTSGARSLTLASVIERMSRDLENNLMDDDYGVSAVVGPDDPPANSGLGRDLLTSALGEIVAALTVRASRLS